MGVVTSFIRALPFGMLYFLFDVGRTICFDRSFARRDGATKELAIVERVPASNYTLGSICSWSMSSVSACSYLYVLHITPIWFLAYGLRLSPFLYKFLGFALGTSLGHCPLVHASGVYADMPHGPCEVVGFMWMYRALPLSTN